MQNVRDGRNDLLRTTDAIAREALFSCVCCGSGDVRDVHLEYGDRAQREAEDVTLCDACGYVQTRVVLLRRAG